MKEEISEHLTGNKDPTPKKLTYKLLLLIVGFIFSGVAGFYLNEYLSWMNAKADMYGLQGSLDKDGVGYFFPITLVNSGQKELTNISLDVYNCFMEKPKEYKIERLITSQKEQIKFRDRTTFDMFTKKMCSPDYNFSISKCTFMVYRINQTELYVPPTNCSVYLCDFCHYLLIMNANQLDLPVFYEGRFFSPQELKLKIAPKNEQNISMEELNEYSPISVNFMDWKELCIWEGTCSVYDLPEGTDRPALPLDLTLIPIGNINPLNLTISYP